MLFAVSGPIISNSVIDAYLYYSGPIPAHKALYSIGILHRDISNTNVLLGKKDAAEGYRGILIDLGVAFYYGPDADLEKITKEARSVSTLLRLSEIRIAH
jgi:serine/threonine protein kinase